MNGKRPLLTARPRSPPWPPPSPRRRHSAVSNKVIEDSSTKQQRPVRADQSRLQMPLNDLVAVSDFFIPNLKLSSNFSTRVDFILVSDEDSLSPVLAELAIGRSSERQLQHGAQVFFWTVKRRFGFLCTRIPRTFQTQAGRYLYARGNSRAGRSKCLCVATCGPLLLLLLLLVF